MVKKALDDAAELLSKASSRSFLLAAASSWPTAWTHAVKLAGTARRPVCNSYLHNDSFPAAHRCGAGPLGYQGSKAAMKLISKADVVLALGTRLEPFGTLPQHGHGLLAQKRQDHPD